MSYPLQSMLKIRAMREDRAATDLTRARRARADAERVLRERTDVRVQYEKTKEDRRDSVYATVIGRKVRIDTLDEVRDAVNRIDEEGVLLEEAERKAVIVLEEKSKVATAAQVRYLAAEKNKQKIEMHREAWLEEDLKECERISDAELEEFAGRRQQEDADD